MPPPRAIVATLVTVKPKGTNKRLLKIVVRFADTGAVQALFNSPFTKPAYLRIAVLTIDTNGDGVTDAVRVTALKAGPRRKLVKKIFRF